MFTRITAEPTGEVKFYCGDKVVVIDKYGIQKTKITLYEKESYGFSDICQTLRHNSSQYSMDELLDDLSTVN